MPHDSALPSPKRQAESLLDPFVAVAFWTLAVIVLLNVRGLFSTGTNGALLVIALQGTLCLFLVGMVRVRLSQALGTPGALILGTIAAHLFIGFIVSVATGAETRGDLYLYVKYHAIFLMMFVASATGGRAIMERVGADVLVKWILMISVACCIGILLSPILRSFGWVPEPEDDFRFTGTFLNPNDAGLIGCMTVVLALAFLRNVRHSLLGYLGLTVAFVATCSSFSKTALVSLLAILIFFLLLNGRGGRGPILAWLGALVLIGAIIVVNTGLKEILRGGQAVERVVEVGKFLSGSGFNDRVITKRWTLWKLSWQKVLESPIVGYGLGQFRHLEGAPVNWNSSKREGSHNIYLSFVGEAGVVPLSLYLLYLFSLLRLRWTAPESLARDVIVGCTVVLILTSFTSHDMHERWPSVFLSGVNCAMAAVLTALSPGESGQDSTTLEPKSGVRDSLHLASSRGRVIG